MGIIGYSISLAVSVNKLTIDKIQTVFVMYFKICVCLFLEKTYAISNISILKIEITQLLPERLFNGFLKQNFI